MPARIISTIVIVLIFMYSICLVIFFFLHQNIKSNINKVNYEAAEVAATSGVLSSETYSYLSDSVNRYGDYMIKLKLEKQVKPGIYDVFFESGDIIDKELQVGDKLTIYLEDKNLSLFGKLVNSTILGYTPDGFVDGRIKSIKTAVIAKKAENLAKGYDVIADIEKNSGSVQLAILVVTKLNPAGKYYGLAAHEYIDADNLHYGDSTDESGNTGVNYIFDNGDFIKTVELYPDGVEKLIKYVQQ